MTILLVEDDIQSVESCRESASLSEKEIEIKVAKNLAEAKSLFNDEIDTAIVDIKLENDADAGNSVIEEIEKLSLRIPTVIHTGTPDSVQVDALKVFVRGENTYTEIFDYLFDVYNTGINEILGRKGLLEQQINKFYNSVFINTQDSWIEKGKTYSTDVVKKALLRNAIYHLESLLDDDNEKTFLEEFYLYDSDKKLHTGSIIKNIMCDKYYVLISPSCDLVIRKDGKRNVDVFTLCEIDSIENHGVALRLEDEPALGREKRNKISNVLSNSKNRYHWIPEIKDFNGGILDFTKTISIDESGFKEEMYAILEYRISPPYMKNILSRFSSYYARQGQPDLDVDSYLNKLKFISDGDIK